MGRLRALTPRTLLAPSGNCTAQDYLYMRLSWRLLRPFSQAGSCLALFVVDIWDRLSFSCSWARSSIHRAGMQAVQISFTADVPKRYGSRCLHECRHLGLIFTPFVLLDIDVFSPLPECRQRIACPWVEESTHWSWAAGPGMNE